MLDQFLVIIYWKISSNTFMFMYVCELDFMGGYNEQNMNINQYSINSVNNINGIRSEEEEEEEF